MMGFILVISTSSLRSNALSERYAIVSDEVVCNALSERYDDLVIVEGIKLILS